jgi:hypothetical protein
MGDHRREDLLRPFPVLVDVEAAVAAEEGIHDLHPHGPGTGDDLPEVADHLVAVGRVGMERVGVVAEAGYRDATLREAADDLLALPFRQAVHVDVGRPGIAPLFTARRGPAGDLEGGEAIGARPVGDLHQGGILEGCGQ